MTKYIGWNKGSIEKLPTPEKRTRYYHNYLKGLHIDVMKSGKNEAPSKTCHYRGSPHKTSSHRTNFSIRLILKYFNSSHST